MTEDFNEDDWEEVTDPLEMKKVLGVQAARSMARFGWISGGIGTSGMPRDV
ncbi:MAG: hypothetical protein JWN69_2530 [Alphaproteobacteria bacterium]|nr:hypothetical protein [Alphaproteobacteria bacterium]